MEIRLELDSASLERAGREIRGQLGGLRRVVASMTGSLGAALGDFFSQAVVSGDSLDKELLVLRLALGKLKAAIGEAVAPLAGALIPWLQQAAWGATRLVNALGAVVRALFGGSESVETMNASTKKLTASTGKLKRTLASFDTVERLGSGSSASGSAGSVTVDTTVGGTVTDHLTPRLQAVVDKVRSLLEPLKAIDLSGAAAAFGTLKTALEPFTQALFAGLEWAWHNLLVPLAAWAAGEALPAFLNLLSGGLGMLGAIITAVKPMATWLWETFLQPLARWAGGAVLGALETLTGKLTAFSGWIGENRELVQWLIGGLAALAVGFGLVKTAALAWSSPLGAAQGLLAGLVTVLGAVTLAGSKVKEKLAGLLDSGGLKKGTNGLIALLNGAIAGVQRAINGIVAALNSLSFTVPAWVPGLGGKTLGFHLKSVSLPQIPYLAQGAVLPANEPFLAVVGDQKHGTNVEAPLATIQEAVAAVMGDLEGTNAAGFAATVDKLEQLLALVSGIELGDTTIGRAARRYEKRMATMRGGAY